MPVKPGYKQTEVGVIPVDWEVFLLSENFRIYAGGDVPKNSVSNFRSETHPYPIFANSLQQRGLYGFTAERRANADSLTITARGYLGHAEYRTESYFPIVRLLVLEPNGLLNAQFTTFAVNERVKFAFESTGVPQLTAPQVGRYSVSAPPLAEQQAIVSALSDADALIESLERLLAKKRLLKQGAMQSLLTGKTRLPGFSGKWERASINEKFSKHTGVWGHDTQTTMYSITGHIIRAGDISPDGQLMSHATRFLSPDEFSKSKCELDDVVITSSGNGLGKSWYCDGRPMMAASNFVRILRPMKSKISGLFFAQVMKSEQAAVQLKEHTAISAYPNLRPSFFESPWLNMPPLAEQTAIATVLSDMDADIAAVEAKLGKARQLKQGMMQELLTGRIRLV